MPMQKGMKGKKGTTIPPSQPLFDTDDDVDDPQPLQPPTEEQDDGSPEPPRVITEDIPPGEESEDEDGGAGAATKPGRRRPAIKIIYTDQQELDLADWFRENPIFYKGRRDYKDSAMKAALYDLKGKAMDPPVSGE